MCVADDRIAVAAIFRDQALYLEEWLVFHQLVGVDHFFLYDNNSSDEPNDVLLPFKKLGIVTLVPWNIPFHERAAQLAYANALQRSRGYYRWLACLDIDEFLFAPRSYTLHATLRQRRKYPGIVVHWQCYGSSGHQGYSSGTVIERFQYRAPRNWVRNRRVKSIVNPERAIRPTGCHHFQYAQGALAVTESGREVRELPKRYWLKRLRPFLGKLPIRLLRLIDPYAIGGLSSSSVVVNDLRINHYPVKSREEFVQKSSFMKEKGRYRGIDYFSYHDCNAIHDPILLRYLPELTLRLRELRNHFAVSQYFDAFPPQL